MRQLPAIFNGHMVRAILDQRKTETRRPIKCQPVGTRAVNGRHYIKTVGWPLLSSEEFSRCFSPLGQAGDLLYVRETWQTTYNEKSRKWGYIYKADGGIWIEDDGPMKWRPSIHMPKEATRIWLLNKEVAVKRIQDITEAGVKAEGLACITKDNGRTWKWGLPDYDGLPGGIGWPWEDWEVDPREAFRKLWESIYPGSWERNDWVFNTKFEQVAGPVTAVE